MNKNTIWLFLAFLLAIMIFAATSPVTAAGAELTSVDNGKTVTLTDGTKIRVPDCEEDVELELWGECTLTWYCGCERCNGKGCAGIDCKGRPLVDGITAANNLLPLGTEIYIEGQGVYEIRDRGGKAMNGKHIDIYTALNHKDALRCLPQGTKANVYIVRRK